MAFVLEDEKEVAVHTAVEGSMLDIAEAVQHIPEEPRSCPGCREEALLAAEDTPSSFNSVTVQKDQLTCYVLSRIIIDAHMVGSMIS